MRRIITGHNEEGKSVISIDGPPARSIGEEAGGLLRFGIPMDLALIQNQKRIVRI